MDPLKGNFATAGLTIEGKMLDEMVARGLSPEEAGKVMTAYKASEDGADMEGEWDEMPGSYPKMMINVIWMDVQSEAAKWIEENCPKHWAKSNFTNGIAEGANPQVS